MEARQADSKHFRSVEELSFDFALLMHTPVNSIASLAFEHLWEEANEAAVAFIDEMLAERYIDFLKTMKSCWRFNP